MTAILLTYLVLAIQLANMMMTHGAHLRRRLQELPENTSSSSTGVFFLHFLAKPKETEDSPQKINLNLSNSEKSSSSYQLTFMSKYFFPEKTKENIEVGLKDLGDAISYQSLIYDISQAPPDLDSKITATGDYYGDLHVMDDYYATPPEYYTDNVTKSPELDR